VLASHLPVFSGRNSTTQKNSALGLLLRQRARKDATICAVLGPPASTVDFSPEVVLDDGSIEVG